MFHGASRDGLLRSLLLAALFASGSLAALPHAAIPEPGIPELTSPPLDDFVEYPQFDSVVISPRGTHLAAAMKGMVSIIDLPSLKSRSTSALTFTGMRVT